MPSCKGDAGDQRAILDGKQILVIEDDLCGIDENRVGLLGGLVAEAAGLEPVAGIRAVRRLDSPGRVASPLFVRPMRRGSAISTVTNAGG